MIVCLLTALAYLLGSIPFGLLLTRAAGLGDIRAIGSGNIGATNVLRTGNKGLAAATVLLDGGKGTLAVLIAQHFGYPAPFCAGFAVFLGHLFPVWLKFRGGKGVATGLGIMLAEFFPLGLILCAIWLLVAFLRRMSSAAALAAFGLAPLLATLLHRDLLSVLAQLIMFFIVYTHRANIGRIANGTEPRIGKPGV